MACLPTRGFNHLQRGFLWHDRCLYSERTTCNESILVAQHLSLRRTEPCLTEKIIVCLIAFLSASWPQSACYWPGLGPDNCCWRWHDRCSQGLELRLGSYKVF